MGVAQKIKFESIDNLFGTDKNNDIIEVNISELNSFKNHPFKVVNDEKMQDLVESIKEYGVLTPITVRVAPEGYEVISGHRRTYAANLAGLQTVPVVIRDLSDDEATIIMVDSNIQREELLPSEKAFAYKMKLEAMKNSKKTYKLSKEAAMEKDIQKILLSKFSETIESSNLSDNKDLVKLLKEKNRNSGGSLDTLYFQHIICTDSYVELTLKKGRYITLTWTEVIKKIKACKKPKSSVELLAEEVGESRANIQRFIRLTELIPELLEMLDERKMPINVGLELSYINKKAQKTIANTIDELSKMPSISQAKQLREYYLQGIILNKALIEEMLSGDKETKTNSINIKSVEKYFPASYTKKDIEEKIIYLLEKYKDEL